MQTVGAAWLMVSLGGGPLHIALIQTASTVPFFVLALPGWRGLGDIVDRRRLILVTEYWMLPRRRPSRWPCSRSWGECLRGWSWA